MTDEKRTPDAAVLSSAGLGLAPDRGGQAWMMTVSQGGHRDLGHWYSPVAVREMIDAAVTTERERWRSRLTEWMTEQGLLHYSDHCKRPDGSNGPAWVVRQPFMVAGDTCEAWHATSAAGAVEAWLSGPNVGDERRL